MLTAHIPAHHDSQHLQGHNDYLPIVAVGFHAAVCDVDDEGAAAAKEPHLG